MQWDFQGQISKIDTDAPQDMCLQSPDLPCRKYGCAGGPDGEGLGGGEDAGGAPEAPDPLLIVFPALAPDM